MKKCKVKLATNCEDLFRTPKKRPMACDKCKKALRKLGLSAEKYLQISRSKKMNTKETMVWDNANEGTMTIEKEHPIMKGNKVTGTSTSTDVSKATYENLVYGLNILAEQMNKANKEVSVRFASYNPKFTSF